MEIQNIESQHISGPSRKKTMFELYTPRYEITDSESLAYLQNKSVGPMIIVARILKQSSMMWLCHGVHTLAIMVISLNDKINRSGSNNH